MPPRTRSISARPTTSARARTGGPTWETVEPAPVVLLLGPEDLLAERARDRIVGLTRAAHPDLELTHLQAAGYTAGRLAEACSPSLFDEVRCVVLEDLAEGTDAAFTDVAAYLADPQADAVLVLRHRGGNRGKKVLDAVKAACPVVACDTPRRDTDREAFAAREFARARRRVDPDALRALVEAVGSDLRELAAGCRQLMDDTAGTVTAALVERYYGGRVETTGFKVADAAVAGNAAEAVLLARHAVATGVDPIPIVAAMALKLRTLAKVAGARAAGLDPTGDLGLPSWQVDRARRDLRRWDADRLAEAIQAVARADADIKGASRSPGYALERAVLAVAAAARGRR